MYREMIIFQGSEFFTPIFAGPGLVDLCERAATVFGYSKWKPKNEEPSLPPSCSPDTVLSLLGLNWDRPIAGVVVSHGFKERLYSGSLVWLPCQAKMVKVGACDAIKVPLFDRELFPEDKQATLEHLYVPELSKYLYYSLFLNIAQSLRLKNIDVLISAMEDQFLKDQYKVSKLAQFKEYPCSLVNSQDPVVGMVIDASVAELALSYGMSFLEAPQESSTIMNYSGWHLFSECETVEDRCGALEEFIAKLAVHVHAQIFSLNSILYLNRIGKVNSQGVQKEAVSFNSYFIHGGLGHLSEISVLENGTRRSPAPGSEQPKAELGNYGVLHLAYAASFCPQALARICYYLQFAQHQKISAAYRQSLKHYLCSAANTAACDLCGGGWPAVCIHTLKFRLDDRFPQVTVNSKREPYIVTGVSGSFNDLGILGNFASFRDKDEEAQAEDGQRYTYWKLMQRVLERLQEIGVDATGECQSIKDIKSFLKTFRAIDNLVDSEAVAFTNSMVKNNVNFKETIKGIHHVLQFSCNVNWLPPCSIFTKLFYRSLLTVIQDIALPICAIYEQENPSLGTVPSEWLRLHFQTLWTNFKSACFDKGVLTGTDIKVSHNDPQMHSTAGGASCDFFDVDNCDPSRAFVSQRVQLRIARPMITIPKTIKMKNRIIFSNSGASEVIQSSFLRVTKKEHYIVNGPYINFLHAYHKALFPNCKISAIYLWNSIADTKQIPLLPGVEEADMKEIVNYVNNNSIISDESNVLDITPHNLKDYALHRLNNAILRSCGQTQFYASTFHSLVPVIQRFSALDYPHALGAAKFKTLEEFMEMGKNKTAITVITSQKQSVFETGKQRPVITVPMVVNKYSGINGNAQIFQCANIGYFSGRGVDRNLMSDGMSFRKQSGWAFMRKRHVFMTPLVDTLIKKSVPVVAVSEVELLKKNILCLLERPDPNAISNIILELFKSIGFNGCMNLTHDDLDFYLGHIGVLADELYAKIKLVCDKLGEGEWEEADVAAALDALEEGSDLEGLKFIALDGPQTASSSEGVAQPMQVLSSVSRKRKLVPVGEIDL